jgi:Cu2+-exporting ATPase
LATPLAITGGLRDALRRGMVVTDATLFETAPRVKTVIFDKTGTLTTGEMTVQSVIGDQKALTLAAAIERQSSHPAADAIVAHAESTTDGDQPEGKTVNTQQVGPVVEFERHPGEGVSGVVDGQQVVIGTPEMVVHETAQLPSVLEAAVTETRRIGDLPVVVGVDGEPTAVIVIGDQEREEWTGVVDAFSDCEVVILTGDDNSAAERFRDHPAVDSVFAGVPPDGKVATVERLASEDSTAMVGDGTNDAPALAVADVGIAVGGTARAAEAADVAIVDGSLADVPAAFDLATGTRRRIRENIAWALCYNAVAIPLSAAGVFNPLFAALAMAGSSILVVTNSRRRIF